MLKSDGNTEQSTKPESIKRNQPTTESTVDDSMLKISNENITSKRNLDESDEDKIQCKKMRITESNSCEDVQSTESIAGACAMDVSKKKCI